jgi:hypothetical protein
MHLYPNLLSYDKRCESVRQVLLLPGAAGKLHVEDATRVILPWWRVVIGPPTLIAGY